MNKIIVVFIVMVICSMFVNCHKSEFGKNSKSSSKSRSNSKSCKSMKSAQLREALGRCSLKDHLCAIDTTQKKLCELTFITNDELCNGIDDCPLRDDEVNCRCTGELPKVNYGAYTLNSGDRGQGSVANLVCIEGYQTADIPPVLTCKIVSQKYEWNGTVGICTPKACGAIPPLEPLNLGKYTLTGDDTFGSSAVFTCLGQVVYDGDDLVTITCTAEETWTTSAAAMCSPKCSEELPPVCNGAYMINSGDTSIDALATLICNEGYTPIDNDNTLTCEIAMEMTVWAGTIGTCTPKSCGAVPTLDCSNNKYKKMLETNDTGAVVAGDKIELMEAAFSGSSIRVNIPSRGLFFRLQNWREDTGELCAQAVLSVTNGDTYELENWEFFIFCTNGHVSSSDKYPVGSTQTSSPTSTVMALKWFARPPSDGPALELSKDGQVMSGSVSNIIDAVKQGYGVTLTETDSKLTVPASNLAYDPQQNDEVALQSVWRIGESDSSYQDIHERTFWSFSAWSSKTGLRDDHHWTVGLHEERSKVENQQNTKWFVDPCWTLAYRHSASGAPLEGCYQALVDGIKDGHRVKVLIKEDGYDILIEPTLVEITEGEYVSATYMNEVSNDGDLSKIKANTTRVWRLLDTTGFQYSMSWIVGGSFLDEDIQSTREMIWFLDTQSWENVVNIENSGTVTLGKKATWLPQ